MLADVIVITKRDRETLHKTKNSSAYCQRGAKFLLQKIQKHTDDEIKPQRQFWFRSSYTAEQDELRVVKHVAGSIERTILTAYVFLIVSKASMERRSYVQNASSRMSIHHLIDGQFVS